jgi:integrase
MCIAYCIARSVTRTAGGLVEQNVATLVSPPRVASTEIELLTPAEVQIVLGKLEGRSIYPILVTALATGMRRGELLALRWQNVDLDGAVLRVEQSLEQTKAGLRFKSPKTKHGRRSITLPASAVTVLRDHWKAQKEQRLKLGMGKAPTDSLVFATWEGKPRSPNSLTKEWWEAVRSAGMPPVTLHSLRHTHASHLIASGLDVLAISRRLGHGSPTITLGVYGHLFPNTDDRAASAIEAMFIKR